MEREDLVGPSPVRSTRRRFAPFTISVSEEQLVDLRRRVTATKWPEREVDSTQGVQLDVIRALAWATDYDWRAFENRFAALPHYITEIDGVDIHFIHVRSEHEDALPLIVTHGWPGSTVEQLKIIDPLTSPTEHGAAASDAFHLVIPSLPGHGFSGKPTETGWDPIRIARAWVELMGRLGYTRYVAQGGDWGNAVTEQMALLKPPGLLGVHTNMPATVPLDVSKALQRGDLPPAGLSAEERRAYEVLDNFFKTGVGYANEMANRPQYWLTNTAISAARLYWESKLAFFDVKGVEVPVGVTVFPDELYPAPQSWAERAYPNLIHYNKVEEGGHFAAWEQPQTLSTELRATFRSLR